MSVFVQKVDREALMEFFMENGLVKNHQYIPYEKRSEIFSISEAHSGCLNVVVYPCRKDGVILNNSFNSNCYLLTDVKIYQQQDELTSKQLTTLHAKYREFMYKQSTEYMALRRARKIQTDKDAEKFYGDINELVKR